MSPTTVGRSLGDDFFDDRESCSIEPTDLDEVTPLICVRPFSFIKR